jgi:hypothetical protein
MQFASKVLGITTLFLSFVPAIALTDPGRTFTVRDGIEMTRFSDPSSLDETAGVKYSPNGRHFAIVTSRGIISSDRVESTLSIFSVEAVKRYLRSASSKKPPSPHAIATFAANPEGPAVRAYSPVISAIKWSPDSRFVYFIALNSSGDHQLFRTGIDGSHPKPLTSPDCDVRRFDVAKGTVAYATWSPTTNLRGATHSRLGAINQDALNVTGQSIDDILFPDDSFAPHAFQIWSIHWNQARLLRTLVYHTHLPDSSALSEAFSLSPDGRNVVLLLPVETVHKEWEALEPAPGGGHYRLQANDLRLTSNSVLRPKQYSVVDLVNKTVKPLFHAPYAGSLGYAGPSRAIWSPDGSQVVLANTFFPTNLGDRSPGEDILRPCVVAIVAVRTLERYCLYPYRESKDAVSPVLQNVQFYLGGKELSLTLPLTSDLHFKRVKGTWVQVRESQRVDTEQQTETGDNSRVPHLESPPKITIKQSLNTPPVLWVTDTFSKAGKLLLDPNPQFASIRLGEASVLQWSDSNGRQWTGGLVKPFDFKPGQRYPLVIQIYNFDPHQFMTDGEFPTAMAARPLANSGILVLQMQRKLPHTMDTNEADDHLAGFLAAIDELSRQGIIDRDKVGLVGFSWTCWYVENALEKAPDRFAAAVVSDGNDNSYMEYHLWAPSNSAIQHQLEQINGAQPEGEGLQRWFQSAPGFRLDRVRTPLRIEAIRAPSVLLEWEIYSSLRLHGKPVELVFYPKGQHILQRPLERFASQQGTVDWFSKWLLNKPR